MNPLAFQLSDKPKPIVYSPRRSTESDYDYASLRRLKSIIDATEIVDPMVAEEVVRKSDGWVSDEISDVLIPSRFLELAHHRRPSNPEATASAFANWVYSLTSLNSPKNTEAMAKGLALESQIEKRRAWLSDAMYFVGVGDIPVGQGSEWRLVHNGLHREEPIPWEERKPVTHFYEIEDLRVGGLPLRASPDLVFRNMRSKDVLIVEIKFSARPIPPKLWPNVWAQLWAYSQIPILRDSNRVTAIGEIWGEWFSNELGGKVVGLRASVRRDARKLAFDRFFRTLFDIYRGVEPGTYVPPVYVMDSKASAVRVRKRG
jgi:hypothetical protein